jgi:hypothetical protein
LPVGASLLPDRDSHRLSHRLASPLADALVSEHPAPGDENLVHYRNFRHVVLDTLEGRSLGSEPPDLDRWFAAERLGEELRRRAVTLTHRAYLVNQGLVDGSVSPENVDRLREAGESVSKVLDEIEDEFG